MAFGMWAVLKRLEAVDLPQPDYSQDTGSLYWILATQMGRIGGSLDMLVLAAIQNVAGQPSWVPDWSADASSSLRDRQAIHDLPALLANLTNAGYRFQPLWIRRNSSRNPRS